MSRRSLHLHTTVPLPAKVRQIDGIQILRAIAVTLVTWGHAGLDLGQRLPDFGIYGVDIFFVISGFIMSWIVLHNSQPPGLPAAWEFLRRRLVRIFPIYWIFALLGMARLVHNHTPALYRYAASLFLFPHPQWLRVINLSWTLMFEIFFYFIMSAMLLLTVRRAVPFVIALLCFTSAIGTVRGIVGPFPMIVCNPILMEFVYGAVIALLFYRFGRRRAAGMAVLAVGAAISFYVRAYPPPAANGLAMILTGQQIPLRIATWGLAAALVVGGMVFWSPSIQGRAGLAGVVVGNASYSSYLASTLVLEFSLRLFLKLSPPDGPPSLLRVFVLQLGQVAAVLLVGWLSYQFVEWPMVRALQRRFSPNATARSQVPSRTAA